MKVVFVCHDAGLTGAPKVGFEIARYFSKNHEVIMVVKKAGLLLTFPEYKSAFGKIINVNTSHEVSRFGVAERLLMAKEILQQEKPDLLYVNSVAASDWCQAGKQCNIPVVLHSHEMKNELLSLKSVNIFKKELSKYIDLLITVSPDAERDILQQCSYPFKGILSSVPGINLKSVRQLADVKNFNMPKNIFGESMEEGKAVISMCGIASKRKGSDIFFQSAKKLPQLNFLWIGPWSRKEAPENIALDEYERSRLSNFYLTHETPNPYPYFKGTDIFVLASREDPNPLVVMEALFLSKLCIGFSHTGGSKDLLNRFGILLHGEITAERLISILERIQPGPFNDFISEEKRRLLAKEYNIEFIARKIETEIVSMVKCPVMPAHKMD